MLAADELLFAGLVAHSVELLSRKWFDLQINNINTHIYRSGVAYLLTGSRSAQNDPCWTP